MQRDIQVLQVLAMHTAGRQTIWTVSARRPTDSTDLQLWGSLGLHGKETNDEKLQGHLLRDTDLCLGEAIVFCKVAEQSSKQSETWDTSISPVRQQTDTNTHESLEDVRHCCYCNRAHGPCQCPAWGKICASCNKKKICLGLVAEQEREFKRYSGTMTFRFVH